MPNTLKSRFILSLPLFLLFLSSCTSIDQKQAEMIAVKFVKEHVKFFAKESNTSIGVPEYKIVSYISYLENEKWTIALHIETEFENTTKKNDVIVKVSKIGEVIEFNGQPVKGK